MIVYAYNGTPLIDINVDDTSYRYEEVMGDCNVYLEFALTQHIEIEPGSYIMFQGVKYELLSRESVTIQHTRNYEYKATFSGPQARFSRYIMYNYQDGRVKFEMIAKPKTLLEMVLWNLNNREPGVWSIGSYVDKEEHLVSFNHTNLWDAMNLIANEFDTEWSVSVYGGGYQINLRKNEFNKNSPLSLGYGKNQGFKPGVGRLNYGDFGQVEKVWIEGSDRNISLEQYGWTTLHFPRSFSFHMDANGKFYFWIGQVWYRENGYNSATALSYVTDEYGASVRLASAQSNCVEASLDLTEYYPKRIGTVTSVYYVYKKQYLTYHELLNIEDLDWSEVQVDIVDSTIGETGDTLDYSLCLFSNDEPLTVIFQSGMLAGREFNATFVKEPMMQAVLDPETGEPIVDPVTGEVRMQVARPGNRFELSRATIDGVDMPNATFRPNAAPGGESLTQDTYIVVNCWLPGEYVCDYGDFGGAELDALREAAKFIRDNKDPQFTFKGQVDDLYAHRNWNAIKDKLILGGCISFQNSSIQPSPITTRIIGIKTYVNNPYAPELTLSNETVRGGMTSKIAKLSSDDEHIIEGIKQVRRYSQRSFRDAKETIAMLAGAIDYFSEGINPITVETMSLLVGYEALQFRFFTDRSCNTNADPVYHYDADARTFTLDACVIQHMTHGIKDVTSSRNPNGTAVRKFYDFLRWSMERIVFGANNFIGVDAQTGKSLADTAYYLYAKVDALNVAKDDAAMTPEEATHIGGQFVLTTEKKPIKEKLTAVDGYYYLLVGILNSEYEGGRSFAPLFGFTEILPGQITTDVIRSASGNSYFDLVNNQFKLGNSLSFENNELVLNGAFIQSGNRKYHLGAFRGQWTAGEQYSEGDEVWWQAPDGTISSYIYVYELPTFADANNDPSHPLYWQVFARGDDGVSSYKSTIFCRTNDTPSAPADSIGSYSQPNPPSDTAWPVYDEDGYAIYNLYWSDGIPAGDEMLWATTRIFANGGSLQQESWSEPRQMTDTSDYDVEFALAQPNDATPADPTYGTGGTIDSRGQGNNRCDGAYNSYASATAAGVVWYDQNIDHNLSGLDWTQMTWRAERWMKNGDWGQWAVTQIKGEKGDEGNGILDIDEYYSFSPNGNEPPGSWPWPNETTGVVRPTQQDLIAHVGEYLWTKTVYVYTDRTKQDKVIYSAQYLPSPGAPGSNGYVLVGRGKYNCDEQGYLDPQGADQIYVGDDKVRNVVWYDNGTTARWYMTLDVRSETGGSSTFSGIAPDDTDGSKYWAPFEGSFANIATGLLFATKGYIENAVVRFLETYKANSSARIEASENWLKMYDNNGDQKLEITGDEIDLTSAAISYPTTGLGISRSYQGEDDYGSDSGSFIVCRFSTPGTNSQFFSVDIPAIEISMYESHIYYGGIDIRSYAITLMDGNSTVQTLGSYSGHLSPQTVTTSSSSPSLRGGKEFTIVATFNWDWTVEYQGQGSAWDTVSLSINDATDDDVIVHNSTANIVRIGANGVAINLVNSFSAIFGVESNNGSDSAVIKLEGIYNGNQIGVRMTEAGGLQINTGNGWATPLTS